MDLDADGQTNFLEVQAYFAVNNYLICRQVRDEVIGEYPIKKIYNNNFSYAMNATYNLIDADGEGDLRDDYNQVSDKDIEMFINLYDAGVVNRTLFMLVFEDALQSGSQKYKGGK